MNLTYPQGFRTDPGILWAINIGIPAQSETLGDCVKILIFAS